MESSEHQVHHLKPRRITSMKVAIILGALLIITSAGTFLLYQKYRQVLANNPKREAQSIIDQVAKIVELPGEQPEVATVKDAAKLSNAVLAKKTENGDKLLIYGESKRIVIYRPSTQRVVDILTVQSDTAKNVDSQAVSQKANP